MRSFFILILFFIALATSYHDQMIEKVDTGVSLFFEDVRMGWLTSCFLILSHIGSIKVTLPLCILMMLFLLIKKKYIDALFTMIVFFAVRTFNHYLKLFFLRDRPAFHPIYEERGYSFPSGHSMNSAAIYSFLCLMFIETFITSVKVKRIVITVTAVLIVLIGISRIYLGVHFLTDVLAGFSVGFSTFLLFKLVNTKLKYIFDKNRTI